MTPVRRFRTALATGVIHPFEWLAGSTAVLLPSEAPWAGRGVIFLAVVGLAGAALRRAWVAALLWSLLAAWMAAGAPIFWTPGGRGA